jgi:hypothetical protein
VISDGHHIEGVLISVTLYRDCCGILSIAVALEKAHIARSIADESAPRSGERNAKGADIPVAWKIVRKD